MTINLKTVYSTENPPFTTCPFCGCDKFYTKERVVNPIMYIQRFDGRDCDEENEEMYDNIGTEPASKFAFCLDCGKRVFRIDV